MLQIEENRSSSNGDMPRDNAPSENSDNTKIRTEELFKVKAEEYRHALSNIFHDTGGIEETASNYKMNANSVSQAYFRVQSRKTTPRTLFDRLAQQRGGVKTQCSADEHKRGEDDAQEKTFHGARKEGKQLLVWRIGGGGRERLKLVSAQKQGRKSKPQGETPFRHNNLQVSSTSEPKRSPSSPLPSSSSSPLLS